MLEGEDIVDCDKSDMMSMGERVAGDVKNGRTTFNIDSVE
jgi:hypothetical protein